MKVYYTYYSKYNSYTVFVIRRVFTLHWLRGKQVETMTNVRCVDEEATKSRKILI